MTKIEDLEERIDDTIRFALNIRLWIGLLTVVVFLIIIYLISTTQYYTSASPDFFCEQGLIEWEYENSDDIQKVVVVGRDVCNETDYGYVCKGGNETRIHMDKTKSCPYSGPGIMVMPDA